MKPIFCIFYRYAFNIALVTCRSISILIFDPTLNHCYELTDRYLFMFAIATNVITCALKDEF